MPPTGSGPASVDAERAVERLSEDETLRGHLDDDGFGPIFGFVVNLGINRAPTFQSTDALYLALKGLLVAVVQAAVAATTNGIKPAAEPLLTPAELTRVFKERTELGRDPNLNARAIARALSQATGIAINGEEQAQ